MYLVFKRVIIMFIVSGWFATAKSQNGYIGETWSNHQFKEVLNHHKPTLQFSDFPGKVFILDFWAHYCLPCTEAFPHLDSLQAQFKDRLQIIMVNPEGKDSTIRFFKRKNKIYVPKNIPMVTGEKELVEKLKMLSYLWLDSSRILRYSGESYHTTAANIQKFLSDIPLTFKQTRIVDDLNINVPLIAEGEGRWLDSVNFYSYLFHHEFNMVELPRSIPGKNGPVNRFYFPNASILRLYRAAFNNGSLESYTSMPMDIRVKDSSLFFPPTGEKFDENWRINHQYTYDVKVPMSRAGDIYTIMQRDLERYFGLKAEVKILKTDCWVLEPLDRRLFISTSGKAYSSTGKPRSDSTNRFIHWPSDRLWLTLKQYFLLFSTLPLVDRLSYTGPMNFEIHQNVLRSGNMELLKEALKKNGISIRKTKAKMPVLVITD
ncbi:MAG: TlpA family protein disulfide reductase [Chitinophagaceae bacterium]|nr:MAG: TlpA family protein disulfide reductase [Chitinophagaceae bacterium]